MLWLKVVVDQLVNNVVSVLLDELQADGLQVGAHVVTDLSQKVGHSLGNKMRKQMFRPNVPFTCSLLGSTILSSSAVITVSQMVHVTKLPGKTCH